MFLLTVISTKLYIVIILNIRVNCFIALQNHFKNHRFFFLQNCHIHSNTYSFFKSYTCQNMKYMYNMFEELFLQVWRTHKNIDLANQVNECGDIINKCNVTKMSSKVKLPGCLGVTLTLELRTCFVLGSSQCWGEAWWGL